jgi:hypothetical protein
MKFIHLITAVPVLLFLLFTLSYARNTSENNERLKETLEKHPQADLDGDGVLTGPEAREKLDHHVRLSMYLDSELWAKGIRTNPFPQGWRDWVRLINTMSSTIGPAIY